MCRAAARTRFWRELCTPRDLIKVEVAKHESGRTDFPDAPFGLAVPRRSCGKKAALRNSRVLCVLVRIGRISVEMPFFRVEMEKVTTHHLTFCLGAEAVCPDWLESRPFCPDRR
jgi:hypothetical protein